MAKVRNLQMYKAAEKGATYFCVAAQDAAAVRVGLKRRGFRVKSRKSRTMPDRVDLHIVSW